MVNVLVFSRAILASELVVQVGVLVTESASNVQYRKFPPSAAMMGYSGQSLLVIIVAILLILMTLLILRNLGRILVNTAWKLSLSCIGFSLASIAFRTFSSGFVVDSSSEYYIATYNVTSYLIIIGATVWIPFMFCKSDKYRPATIDAERHRNTTTNGPRPVMTHRPHADEDNSSVNGGTRDELPSYYEMLPPPSYKNTVPQSQDENNGASSPPTADIHVDIPLETINENDSNSISRPPPTYHNDVSSPPPSTNAPYNNDDDDMDTIRSATQSVVTAMNERTIFLPDDTQTSSAIMPAVLTVTNEESTTVTIPSDETSHGSNTNH